MKRLTKRIENYVYYNDNGSEVLAAEIMQDEIFGTSRIKEILNKLADYEDTGCDPNEIKEILKTHKEDKKENSLTVKIDARNLDCIKNTIEVINNQVVCQGGFFSDYDKELLDALLGDNWINEYAIGEKYIEF